MTISWIHATNSTSLTTLNLMTSASVRVLLLLLLHPLLTSLVSNRNWIVDVSLIAMCAVSSTTFFLWCNFDHSIVQQPSERE